jgi:hypothetical protein
MTIGNQEVVPGGRWNREAMASYVLKNGVDDWISVGRLAKVGCGANTIPNKKRVRSRLSQLFELFLERGFFLAIDYGGHHNSATSVKIADLTSGADRENVEARLERMRSRKELTQERYERFMELLHSKREVADGGDEGPAGGRAL